MFHQTISKPNMRKKNPDTVREKVGSQELNLCVNCQIQSVQDSFLNHFLQILFFIASLFNDTYILIYPHVYYIN